MARGSGPTASPLVLAFGADAPAQRERFGAVFGALQLSGRVSLKPNVSATSRLLLRSPGDPLFVCLALQQLQHQHYAAVAADELLLDRAQHIVEALKRQGVGTADQLRAIAWATLAAGSTARRAAAEPPPGDSPR